MEKNAYSIIIEPVLTEKSNDLREQEGKKKHYTFKVHRDANKVEIVKAIKKIYDVEPLSCRVVNIKPKRKNRRMSALGYTRSWKKAIITLDDEKDSIELVK